MNKCELLAAMRADAIPEGWAGLWYIRKQHYPQPVATRHRGKAVTLPRGTYTFLHRLTDATIYAEPAGEVVMEDTPFELRTHLGFVMRARGRVLVTGLGLGCVVRGLLANPAVAHVTCIENSSEVLKLVKPRMPAERLTIVEADALAWTGHNQERFECAWHDVWTDRDRGEPHLDMWHLHLLMNCRAMVEQQGAWSFDRQAKQQLRKSGFPWMG